MGGNLFEGTRRHTTEALEPLAGDVQRLMSALGLGVRSIPNLTAKRMHGDYDLICDRATVTLDRLRQLASGRDYRVDGKLTPLSCFEAGRQVDDIDVFSYRHADLQVDLIMVDTVSVDFAVHYHAYNDLGGIIGACLRPMGLRLGREGLFYGYQPLAAYPNARIYLTRDFKEFARVFRLDIGVYENQPLRDVDAMYAYLKAWPYFNSDYMAPDRMNATRRNRAAKRTVFQQVATLAEREGGVRNYVAETTPVAPFKAQFDLDSIGNQEAQAREAAYALKRRKDAFGMTRVKRMLGFTPDKAMFRRLSESYGGPNRLRDMAVDMSDEQFRDFLLKFLEDKHVTKTRP